MDLIIATYKNIGPFKEKVVTVNFKKGKYLIKAPIGTGKSFLFFDGPLFGLYGSSRSVGRAILNMRSKQGVVELLFEDKHGQKWLIKRDISRTSGGGEKVVSTLFKVNKQDIDVYLNSIFEDVLTRGKEVHYFVQPYLEVEEFKSSRELQKTLELLIPPKEVFLSTSFLMQDSDNIFEMMPSERIKVFKEMFDLLDVDMAKERVADYRKEIRGQIKALEDTTVVNERLKSALNLLYLRIKKLLEQNLNISSEKIDQFIEEYGLWGGKINVSTFDLDLEESDLKPWEEVVKIKIQQYQHLKASYGEKQEQEVNLKKQIDRISQQLKQFKDQKSKIENEIKQIEQLNFEDLEKEKKKLLNELGELESKVSWEQLGIKKGDYSGAFVLFKELEEEGKRLNQQISNLEERLHTFESQRNKIKKLLKALDKGGSKYQQLLKKEVLSQKAILVSELKNIKDKVENLQENQQFLRSQLEEVNIKLKNFDKQSFWCKHINAECPFIKDIGKKVFEIYGEETLNEQASQLRMDLENIEKQIKQLLEQQKKLENKLQNIEKEVDISTQIEQEKKQILSAWNLEDIEKQIKQIDYNLRKYRSLLESKRNEYKNLGGVSFKREIWPKWEVLSKKIMEIDNQIETFKFKKQEKEKLLSQITKIEGELHQLEQHQKSMEMQLVTLQSLLQDLKRKMGEINLNYLEEINENIHQIKTSIVQIKDILKDFGWRKKELEKLKEKEKVLKDLTNILGKELMVVILQNFLPALEDQINSLLSEVVEFQLNFAIKESKGGEQQLDIKIVDMRGEREVKSLSGGQKVVLRLAWILSVSRLLNAKFLFLDETINNLDAEAIGRVANMLKNFLDKSLIEKFYVVTHSSQIQNMDIWNEVVEII